MLTLLWKDFNHFWNLCVLMAVWMTACWFLHTSEQHSPVEFPGWRCRALHGSHSSGPPRWSRDLLTPASVAPRVSRSAPVASHTHAHALAPCWFTITSKLQAVFRSLFEVPQERGALCVVCGSDFLSLDIWFELYTTYSRWYTDEVLICACLLGWAYNIKMTWLHWLFSRPYLCHGLNNILKFFRWCLAIDVCSSWYIWIGNMASTGLHCCDVIDRVTPMWCWDTPLEK